MDARDEAETPVLTRPDRQLAEADVRAARVRASAHTTADFDHHTSASAGRSTAPQRPAVLDRQSPAGHEEGTANTSRTGRRQEPFVLVPSWLSVTARPPDERRECPAARRRSRKPTRPGPSPIRPRDEEPGVLVVATGRGGPRQPDAAPKTRRKTISTRWPETGRTSARLGKRPERPDGSIATPARQELPARPPTRLEDVRRAAIPR